MKTFHDDDLIQVDLAMFGRAYKRKYADGTIERIPVEEMSVIYQNGNACPECEDKQQRIKNYQEEINLVSHENGKLKEAIENREKIMKEMGERFHAKLMSVYYMLGTIKKMGTHHEKSVAVGYVMTTVDDLLKNDPLSWNQDWFENHLPF
jgi:hypothetical protein